MCIIEKMVEDHRRSVEAWKHACDKWGNDPAYENRYRSEHEYERKHPRPGEKLKTILRATAIIIAVAGVGTLIVLTAINSDSGPKPAPINYKNGDKCGNFKIGD